MKTRSISAIGVVLVGIVPALFGGPVWALTFAAICMIAFIEYPRHSEQYLWTHSQDRHRPHSLFRRDSLHQQPGTPGDGSGGDWPFFCRS